MEVVVSDQFDRVALSPKVFQVCAIDFIATLNEYLYGLDKASIGEPVTSVQGASVSVVFPLVSEDALKKRQVDASRKAMFAQDMFLGMRDAVKDAAFSDDVVKAVNVLYAHSRNAVKNVCDEEDKVRLGKVLNVDFQYDYAEPDDMRYQAGAAAECLKRVILFQTIYYNLNLVNGRVFGVSDPAAPIIVEIGNDVLRVLDNVVKKLFPQMTLDEEYHPFS